MIASNAELSVVLRQYNPWWTGARSSDLPGWHRAAFREIASWLGGPPGGRALLLSGARQTGKTTLFLQTIDRLIERGVPAANILYATFDHPLLKLAGLDTLLRSWRESQPAEPGPEYLFLDEIQMAKDWQVWVKHQVDFEKRRRIAVTGSATPLLSQNQESGVGRWQTLRLATLSFYEYLKIRGVHEPGLPALASLRELFDWPEARRAQTTEAASLLSGHFHEYLLRGGFPQCAQLESIPLAQRLLREDIVDRVLKRDMTAFFGVRRVLELEQTFLYLCLHDGGLLDMQQLTTALELSRPTVASFIDILEASHLIHRLRPFGYGKQILRAKQKIYLADAAIAGSVLLRGKGLLDDPARLAQAVETAFFKHVFTRYYHQAVSFSYWRGKRDREVDIVADLGGQLVPFEVKYRAAAHTGWRELAGMAELCVAEQVERGYVITREPQDFGVLPLAEGSSKLLKIPAALACYWLGRSEVEGTAEPEG